MNESTIQKMALRIVQGLAPVKNEYILLSGGLHHAELLEQVAMGIVMAEAHPEIRFSTPGLARQMAEKAPASYLDRTADQHDIYMATHYDAALQIDPFLDESLMAGLPIDRMILGRERGRLLSDLRKARATRSIFMGWPSPARAESCGMEFPDFQKLFTDAFLSDMNSMKSLGESIAGKLRKGGQVRITCPLGSDVTFTLSPHRRVMIDTGSYDPEMVRAGDITKNLPCGEVYTTAVETTVEGRAIFDTAFVDGRPIRKLELTFQEGELVNFSAAEGVDLFRKRYESASGRKERLGELGIGINPAMKAPIGHTLLDEKIFGSVHLALGENRMYGGVNASSLHWDLVMLKPTLTIGDECIITNGCFE